jgi:hypothetical protein
MKFLYLMLFAAATACAAAAERPMNLELEISTMSTSGTIVATLRNRSQLPVRIWNESNSWGAGRWRVLRIRNKIVEMFYQTQDQAFTRNGPGFVEISAGAELKRNLDLAKDDWLGPEAASKHLERGDMVIVILDTPKAYPFSGAPITKEASRLGVWYGVISAFKIVP